MNRLWGSPIYGPILAICAALASGISTIRPLEQARKELEVQGKILRYLDLRDIDKKLPVGLLKQAGGSHADEAETSMML